MISGKTIFISPLDWGLGHATRCIPLIRTLEKNNTIILGLTPVTQKILGAAFPHLQQVQVPSYNIVYSKILPVWLKILFSWPAIAQVIKKENAFLDAIIDQYKINMVVSDNRFGMYSKKCLCVFITHQLFIKAPFGSGFAQAINKKHIMRFSEIWVPDHADEAMSLAGKLSHGQHFHPRVNYIGPQSRLKPVTFSAPEQTDYLLLLSGAEPQRSMLEKKLLDHFKGSQKKIVLVRGTDQLPEIKNKNITVKNLVSAEALAVLITNATTIICRSGYSTLMDLHALEKRQLILIPTPGQTEQEYLASYWQDKFSCKMLRQDRLAELPL